jgi:hypothetical protein
VPVVEGRALQVGHAAEGSGLPGRAIASGSAAKYRREAKNFVGLSCRPCGGTSAAPSPARGPR